jgi:hypothetical protein
VQRQQLQLPGSNPTEHEKNRLRRSKRPPRPKNITDL